MTNKELFIQAFMEADNIQLNKYFDKSHFTHQFSESFEKKMHKMIAKEKRINFSTRRKISKALIAAVIAIIIMFTGLMSVAASRERIIEFIESVFSDNTQITVFNSSNAPETIEKEYELGYLPEGFEITEYEKNDAHVYMVLEHQEGMRIIFEQGILNVNASFDNENYYEKMQLYGYPAYIYGRDNNLEIICSNGDYLFSVSTTGLSEESTIEIAQNIVEKN